MRLETYNEEEEEEEETNKQNALKDDEHKNLMKVS